MIDKEMIRRLREKFRLDWNGVHGARHWARVRENGLRLAESTGANVAVVDLFAFLHDSQRRCDGFDPQHGARAARFAETSAGTLFDLGSRELKLLTAAIRGHSYGLTAGEVTILTCWDADRLDLGRVGIMPDPALLCTAAAREAGILEWAFRRSVK